MFGIQIAANKNKPILSESIFGEGLLFLLLFEVQTVIWKK